MNWFEAELCGYLIHSLQGNLEIAACSERAMNSLPLSMSSTGTAALEREQPNLSKKKDWELLFCSGVVNLSFLVSHLFVGMGSASSQILQANLKTSILFSACMFVYFKFTSH